MYERLSYKKIKYKYFIQAYKSNIKKYIKSTKKKIDLKLLEHFVFCDTVHNCENDFAVAWNVVPLDECIDETNFIIYQKFNIKKFFAILQHIEDFYEWEEQKYFIEENNYYWFGILPLVYKRKCNDESLLFTYVNI